MKERLYIYNFDKSLSTLPSVAFYKLVESSNETCHIENETELRHVLTVHNKIQPIIEEILKSICYIRNHYTLVPNQKDLCDYFYYWLGNKIHNMLKNDGNFNGIIDACYTGLSINGGPRVCNKPLNYVDIKDFIQMKIIHDYNMDREVIEQYLSNTESSCFPEIKRYLEKVDEFYNGIYRACFTNEKAQYCDIYKKLFPEDKNGSNKLSPIKCKELKEYYISQLNVKLDTHVSKKILEPPTQENSLQTVLESTSTSFKYMMDFAIPFVGISILLSVLYKFTPIGVMLQNFFKNSGILTKRTNDYKNEISSEHYLEPYECNSHTNSFKVTYRPT
ncbi:variable surface protein [Plasmodium gonderi]|uniref:Variable surface protein n=1 Tax=Plasmodium gonderi TaxID=77519 RepID=A0A1Y1JRW7_PLAGO|nr:variable surface protein [Plasmodium gonderi]GAW84215.1 variable surface protein [Plasmodium gonderi]